MFKRFILTICFLAFSTSAIASIDRTTQGFVAWPSENAGGSGETKIPVNTWKVISGAWVNGSSCPNMLYSIPRLCTTEDDAELAFNSSLISLPSDYVVQFMFAGTDPDATIDYWHYRFRWQDEDTYYEVRIGWDSSATTVWLYDCDAGTCTSRGSVAFTPAANEQYLFNIRAKAGRLRVWVTEMADTWKANTHANQDDFIEFGTADIDWTDTTSPLVGGQIRMVCDCNGAEFLGVNHFRILKDDTIKVTNVPTNDYAVLCQKPTISQWIASADGTDFDVDLHDSATDGGSNAIKQGQSFRFLEGGALKSVTAWLREVGTVTGNVKVEIRSCTSPCTASGEVGSVITDGTSDDVPIGVWGGTSPFIYPSEAEFTFSTNPTIAADTWYVFALIPGTSFVTDATNYIDIWVNKTDGDEIDGLKVAYSTSWIMNSGQDLVFQAVLDEVVRASAQESSGTATIDTSQLFMPLDGIIKIGTSASCSTGLVDATPRYENFMGGDILDYVASKKLTVGPRLGCPQDGNVPVWVRGHDYTGGNQQAQIQYTTGALADCPTGCTKVPASATNNMSSADDYTETINLTGLSANTFYNYEILIDGTVQASSQNTFTTPPSNSTEVDFRFAASSCFSLDQMPFTHLDNIITNQARMYLGLGDNIYTDNPAIILSSLTKADYWTRHRTTYNELNNASMGADIFTCPVYDDHECKNNCSLVTGTAPVGGTETVISQVYQSTTAGIDDYVSPFSQTKLKAGEDYYKTRWGRVGFVFTEHHKGRDYETDTDEVYYYGQNDFSVANGDAESCTSDGEKPPPSWTASGTTGACDSGASSAGTYSLLVGASENLSQSFVAGNGNSMTLTADIYSFNSVTGILALGTSAGGSEICSIAFTGSTTWTEKSCSGSTTAGNTVYINLISTNASGVQFDEITVTNAVSGIETTLTCTATNGGTDVTCAGSPTFTTESPAISTTEGMVQFEDRIYAVSAVVDSDSLTTSTAIECSTCTNVTGTRIWKTGKMQLDAEQVAYFTDAIEDMDDDSTIDVIFWVSAKPLNVDNSSAQTNEDHWFYYQAQRDFLLDYFNDHTTNEPIVISGDKHKYSIYDHNALAGSISEFLVGNGGAPNDIDYQVNGATDMTVEYPLGKAMGIIKVDTRKGTSKTAVSFQIKDESGNSIYDEDSLYVGEVTDHTGTSTSMNFENNYRINRDSNGYCYSVYDADGSDSWKLEVTQDTDCLDWSGSPLTLTNMVADAQGHGPSMAINGNDIVFAYNKSGSAGQVFMRSAVITAGSPPTVAFSSPSDEVSVGGSASVLAETVQAAWDLDGFAWVNFSAYNVSANTYGIRVKRSDTAGIPLTTFTGNGYSGQLTAGIVIESATITPLADEKVLLVWTEDAKLVSGECAGDTTTPFTDDPVCGTRLTVASAIGRQTTPPTTSGGWFPKIVGDGAGDAAVVYQQSTYPYNVQINIYDESANTWGTAADVNDNGEMQMSPSIAAMDSYYLVGWLDSFLGQVKLYKSEDFALPFTWTEQVLVIDDGWRKSRLQISPDTTGVQAMLFYQRLFGINKSGHGQPTTFRANVLFVPYPYLFQQKLWREVNP